VLLQQPNLFPVYQVPFLGLPVTVPYITSVIEPALVPGCLGGIRVSEIAFCNSRTAVASHVSHILSAKGPQRDARMERALQMRHHIVGHMAAMGGAAACLLTVGIFRQ